MEFSRRGPATGGAGDGNRFPDPPAHGEREPMLVMRDALLSQLHMACLRQEIIEAELAKIERDIALCAATGGHLTQTTLMPRPWHGVATTDAGWSQPWLVSIKQPMAQQNAEFDEHKLPDPNKDALLSQLHMARLRQEVIKDELAKIERAMALCTATGGHQTLTTPMPMPWHGVATADAGRSQACPLSTEQPVAQQSAEFDDHKLPDSNKVQGTSEQNLHQHYSGQKHLSNIGTLDPATKASHQKAKMAAEPSLGTEEKKTSSIKWSCSTCQANGTSQSTLEAHLKGKRHQQNIAATSAEGDKNGMPKNVTAQEAKSHSMATADAGRSKARPFTAEQPVAQQTAEFNDRKLPDSNKAVPPSKASHAEKWELTGITIPVNKLRPPMKWNCTVCQVQATCEQNLQQHYAGQKHMSTIAILDPTIKASDQKAKMAAERSLGTEEKKTSSIKWSCSACQASGTCHSTLESHLKGRRHQQNIAATNTEGDKNDMPKNVAAQEAKSHSMATADAGKSKAGPFSAEQPAAQRNAEFDDRKLPDSNKAVPPSKASHAEKWELMEITIPVKKLKPPVKWNCTVCQVQATCEQNLQQHYAGQKHMSNIATLDPTTKASDQKAKMATEPSLCTEEKKTSSIKWSCSNCQAKGTSQSTLEAHLKGKRHQQNIVAATNVEGDKNGIPKNVVAQEAEPSSINVPKLSEKPPSVWSCSICEAICTCQKDLKNHLKGIRHRERVQSSLEQSKNKASDSESRKSKLIPDSRWICSICRTHCTCESDLENHLAGRRHQLNIQVLREKIKQENNNPQQLAKNKEPTSELNCLMCEAKCNSKSQFEAHCRSSRHRQAILDNGNIAKGSGSWTKSEVPSDGSTSKNASSEKLVKQPTLYFCEVCHLLFESSTMLVHHRFGKKHRAKLSATNELS